MSFGSVTTSAIVSGRLFVQHKDGGVKRGKLATLGLLTGPISSAERPDPPDPRWRPPKNAGAKANPPGVKGESANDPAELSYGASS